MHEWVRDLPWEMFTILLRFTFEISERKEEERSERKMKNSPFRRIPPPFSHFRSPLDSTQSLPNSPAEPMVEIGFDIDLVVSVLSDKNSPSQ